MPRTPDALLHFTLDDVNTFEKGLSPVALRSNQPKAVTRINVMDNHAISGSDRPPYEHDRDRIIHCRQFRKLLGKTQLLVAPTRGSVRTRLTHTLEVYQLATSIARRLNLNVPLAEAIALGHDTGHTPFGHAGEAALDECLKPIGGFHHAAHSVRTLDRCSYDVRILTTEHTSGLNLTFAVRQGILKHGWFVGRAHTPFHLPPNDLLVWDIDCSEDMPYGSVEAQVVTLADGIAYLNHDIADLLQYGFERILSERILTAFFGRHLHSGDANERKHIKQRFLSLLTDEPSTRVKALVRDAVDASVQRIKALDLSTVYKARLVDYGAQMRRTRDLFYTFFAECVYPDIRIEHKNLTGKQCVTFLFSFFQRLYQGNPDLMPYHIHQEWGESPPWWHTYIPKLSQHRGDAAGVNLDDTAIAAMLAAADVVADMTDNEAIAAAAALKQPGAMAGMDVIESALETFPNERQIAVQRDKWRRRHDDLKQIAEQGG